MADADENVTPMTDRERRILAIVFAPGTEIYPSKINRHPQRYVVVNGLTGLDACERSIEECFDVLLREEDGGPSPSRIDIGVDDRGTPMFVVDHSRRVPA